MIDQLLDQMVTGLLVKNDPGDTTLYRVANDLGPYTTKCSGSRLKEVSKLRRSLALQLVNEFGLSLAESARQLGVSTSAIAQILRRQS